MNYSFDFAGNNENTAQDNSNKYYRKDMQHAEETHFLPLWGIKKLITHFFNGLLHLFVILKYAIHRLVPTLKGRIRLPWFKLALAAFAVFLFLKKDIQFSINMKAPLVEEESTKIEEMGLMKTVSLKKKAPQSEELSPSVVHKYIKRFKKVAIIEEEKFGIPASIKMAQAIIESKAGTSKAATTTNNHFGFPLEAGAYESAWENWRTHSLYLKANYSDLFDSTDYILWAKNLEKIGYSKEKNYAKKLIHVIKQYQLDELD